MVRFLTVVLTAFLLFSSLIFAQGVTTGEMSGKVFDADRKPLTKATISAVHIPSGTKYGAFTKSDGRFYILGMRVGGPYKVTASYVGFESKSFDNVNVNLGTTTNLDFYLDAKGVVSGTVLVTAGADNIFSAERTGAATTVTSANIETLPTISRNYSDFTKLTPQSRGAFGGNSFAGQDNRYNNITVDGSYINNSFGLSGDPGGRTGVAPVSIDALEQIQVSIAPYDVRQGNFVGAGVNMVTKSGTNDFSATAYYQLRNQDFVGTKAMESTFNPGEFNFNLLGATLSGPIIKDKLFFFANFESESYTSPGTTYLANSGTDKVEGNMTRVLASDLDKLSNFLTEKFNYNPGTYQGYDFETPALRMIFKLDYNLDDNNKISLRYNHLDSKSDQLVSNSSSLGFGNRRTNSNSLNFSGSNYAIMENIRTINLEWNTVLSENMTNNVIVGYRFHDESREQPTSLFPAVDILKDGSTYTAFGTEPFTPNNKLTYSTIQFQNNFSLFLKDHKLLFGLSVEKYNSENVFFPGSQSVYVYNSLEEFYTDANDYLANPNRTTSPVKLNRFQYRYSNIPGLTEPVQPLDVIYGGIYAQDEYSFSDNLKFTLGVRMDIPIFDETGYRNEAAEKLFFRDENGNTVQYRTDKMPNSTPLFSPRLGFNYDVFNNKTTQLRGGTGIFTGQPAFVWISNQIGNNGMLTGFERLDNTNARPFNPNPNAYAPSEVTGKPASRYELSLTDPDFKFPQIWRSNFAVDQKLPFDLVGTLEFIYNKDVNGVYYINANLNDSTTNYAGADQRIRWKGNNKINSNIDNAIVLKNQSEGYSWNIAATIEKPMTMGLYGKAGFAYGVAKNTVDAGSIAFGSWNNNQHSGNPNLPGLGISTYTPDTRYFLALSYRFEYLNMGATTISCFFDSYTNGRASYAMSGDFNGDGGTSNDLIYIPKDASEMYFENYTVKVAGVDKTFTKADQEAAWEAYIQQDDYLSEHRGHYAERNGVMLPMVSRLDLSIAQEFFMELGGKRNAFEVRLDILNFTNLINPDWGVGEVVRTAQPLIARPAAADGTPVYRLANVNGELISKTFTNTASLFDVYRLQLALRYKFN